MNNRKLVYPVYSEYSDDGYYDLCDDDNSDNDDDEYYISLRENSY